METVGHLRWLVILGRWFASSLGPDGLAVLWVVGVALAIVADDPSRGVVIVVLVQGVVALGIQVSGIEWGTPGGSASPSSASS